MARLVKHHAAGPIKIEPQDKPVFVCGCGLSRKFPFCDGAHKVCATETADKTYVYGDDRTVIEVRDETNES
jgi:CDGSH-type Zn-finger protein